MQALLTKWIGEEWEKTSANNDMAVRKCGISVVIDGSENEDKT